MRRFSSTPHRRARLVRARTLTGEYRWFSIKCRYLYEGQEPYAAVGKMVDITQQRALEEQLVRRSQIDGLTKALNKVTAEEKITASLAAHDRGLLFMIDVDDFKQINDRNGHRVGDQVLAAIARALVQRARVLLADEPIASLDPESARNVMQTLRDLNQKDGLTVVVTLHQVDYAMRFCPRTVALKKGEIVYDGPTERLTPQFLAELYGAESDELFAAKTSAAQEAVTLPGSPVRETSRAA